MQILQSDLVRVRRAKWRVADIRVYERCQLLTLTGVDATNARTERRILAPFDTVERIERRSRPTRISIRLWRRVCRALIANETPPGGLRCACRARIELLPHQLEPAMALVRGLGSRVLLADAVGLGKTIQAGLIVSELRPLGAGDRVLILTPAGLRDQWARELADRFDLDATILDAGAVGRAVATLPVGINPWRTTPIAIASVDYVKRADILASVAACRWDVLIVDEAHGVAGDSDRHAAVAALASRAPFVVLLTATPHSGDRRAFVSLCRLGSLGAVSSGDPLLVFRRTRADVRLGAARRIHRLLVRPSAAEAHMHASLACFSRAVQREHGSTNPGNPVNLANPANPGILLALSVLHKRALSSAWSLQRSVERRLAALSVTADTDGDQLQLPFVDADGELTAADLPPLWPAVLCLHDPSHERRLLGDLAAAASAAAHRETKIGALGRLLRRIGEPAIVFTEYRDTLAYVRASLEGRLSVLHGGLTRTDRLAAIDEFTSGTSFVLLATDAAGEGLNLHQACRTVINLELPWNPMRLEQRIGRVDRIGQKRPVHAFHLIARDTSEPLLLTRLEARLARAQADIGAPDPLGMDHEDAIARAVIGEADPAEETTVGRVLSEPARAAGPEDPPYVLTPALTADARAEVERIVRARALLRAGDEEALARTDGFGPCLAVAHRSRTRQVLGGRLLLLCRSGMDAGGASARRTAGSMLVPLAIQIVDHDLDTRDLLGRLNADIQGHVEPAVATWRQRTSDVHWAFIGARLNRERAIGAARTSVPTIFQPGLFDRRTEHARLALVAAGGDRDLEWDAALALLEQAAVLTPTDVELLLALAP